MPWMVVVASMLRRVGVVGSVGSTPDPGLHGIGRRSASDRTAACLVPPYRVPMRSFLLRAAVVAIALVAISRLLPQVVVPESPVQLAGLAALFGAANALVRPVVHALTLPIRLMTLGLATVVLNGVLVLGVAWVAGQLDLGFSVGGFPPDLSPLAVGVAVVVAVALGAVSTAAALVIPDF